MWRQQQRCLLVSLLLVASRAFTLSPLQQQQQQQQQQRRKDVTASLFRSPELFMPSETTRRKRVMMMMAEKKNSMSANLKRKLLQETESPWRTVRTFFFGAFGFSATIGGLTALTQLAASISGREGALPWSQTLTNVGIDFGVVIACVFGWQADARASADVRSEPSPALSDLEANERVQKLRSLTVSVATSSEDRREATLETLRAVAKQSVVVVGGSSYFVDDAVTDAFVQKNLFVDAECLVVPVKIDGNGQVTNNFKKPMYQNSGFIALPVGAGDWADYLKTELATAKDQGKDQGNDIDGVVIALRNDGTIAKRGIGKPPWKQLLTDINQPPGGGNQGDKDKETTSENEKKKTTDKKNNKSVATGFAPR